VGKIAKACAKKRWVYFDLNHKKYFYISLQNNWVMVARIILQISYSFHNLMALNDLLVLSVLSDVAHG
jgi:hypothetical protein